MSSCGLPFGWWFRSLCSRQKWSCLHHWNHVIAHCYQEDGAEHCRDAKLLSCGRDLEATGGAEHVQEDTGVAQNDDGARYNCQYGGYEHDSTLPLTSTPN